MRLLRLHAKIKDSSGVIQFYLCEQWNIIEGKHELVLIPKEDIKNRELENATVSSNGRVILKRNDIDVKEYSFKEISNKIGSGSTGYKEVKPQVVPIDEKTLTVYVCIADKSHSWLGGPRSFVEEFSGHEMFAVTSKVAAIYLARKRGLLSGLLCPLTVQVSRLNSLRCVRIMDGVSSVLYGVYSSGSSLYKNNGLPNQASLKGIKDSTDIVEACYYTKEGYAGRCYADILQASEYRDVSDCVKYLTDNKNGIGSAIYFNSFEVFDFVDVHSPESFTGKEFDVCAQRIQNRYNSVISKLASVNTRS